MNDSIKISELFDLNETIAADLFYTAYSTVTDFARFLGLSTSFPLRTAV